MKECPICLKEFEDNQICKTNCNHEYCNICLNNWLDRNRGDCPNCRKNIKSFTLNNNLTRIIHLNQVIPNQENNDLMVELNQITNRITNLQTLRNINLKLKKLLSMMSVLNLIFMSSTIYLIINDCEIDL